MKTISSILFAFIYSLSIAQTSSMKTASQILDHAKKAISSFNYFSYSANYKMKFFDSKDTNSENYSCKISKAPEDKILGYYALLKGMYSDERAYNGSEFLIIFHKQKNITIAYPDSASKRFIQNNIRSQVVPSIFYSSKPYSNYYDTALRLNNGRDTVINKHVCKTLVVTYPADSEITSYKRFLYFDSRTYFPVLIVNKAKYLNIQDEYWELHINSLKPMTNSRSQFSTFVAHPEGYREEIYKASQVDYTLLSTGTTLAPLQFRGLDEKRYDLNALSTDKLVVLDFWYLSCAPCLRSIPELVKLQYDFRDKLLVLGINSKDPFDKKRKEIEQMQNRLTINYPILEGGESVDDYFKVKVYPTVYVIQNNQIVYSHLGYTQEITDSLRSFVQKNIR